MFDFDVNTIVIGNLSVGGTGKTPMVGYLLEKLKSDYPTATLSRGYGRKSKGFLLAHGEVTPREIGDEPYLFYKRYGQEVIVIVGEDRAYAIPAVLYEAPKTQLILLDDGFQHRTVKAGMNVLLTRFDRPFYDDFVLPSGHLRESRSEAKRADVIVVTKCPVDLDEVVKGHVRSRIRKYADATIYFTTVAYQKPLPFRNEMLIDKIPIKYVVVTGIAKNDDFVAYCQATFTVAEVLTFPDHHTYTTKDLGRIAAELSPEIGLLTTEKDWVKLENAESLQGFACYYVPIEVVFLEEEPKFLEEVKNSLKEYPHETFVHQQDH